MIPIYVIHYKPLVERKEYLSRLLPEAIFVDEYGQDKLGPLWYYHYYLPSEERWNRECHGLYAETPPFKILTKGMISCGIAHIEIWRRITDSDRISLILEDDAILCENFAQEWNKTLEEISMLNDWDLIFIGGAFPESICKTLGKKGNMLLKDHPASNTVCAYIIHPNAARRLYKYLLNFTLPIDFSMNYAMKELNMRTWHVNPYIIREGTSAGYYKTSQERT